MPEVARASNGCVGGGGGGGGGGGPKSRAVRGPEFRGMSARYEADMDDVGGAPNKSEGEPEWPSGRGASNTSDGGELYPLLGEDEDQLDGTKELAVTPPPPPPLSHWSFLTGGPAVPGEERVCGADRPELPRDPTLLFPLEAAEGNGPVCEPTPKPAVPGGGSPNSSLGGASKVSVGRLDGHASTDPPNPLTPPEGGGESNTLLFPGFNALLLSNPPFA